MNITETGALHKAYAGGKTTMSQRLEVEIPKEKPFEISRGAGSEFFIIPIAGKGFILALNKRETGCKLDEKNHQPLKVDEENGNDYKIISETSTLKLILIRVQHGE